jgi:uncharacterized protein YsxB (DUF464 family)
MTVCVAQKHILDWERVILTLQVKGHANYAESGKDIVCSAVSCLCISLANTLLAAGVDKQCFRMEEGSFYVSATIVENKAYAEGAFDMAVGGLQMIAEQYPDHVSFKSGVSH